MKSMFFIACLTAMFALSGISMQTTAENAVVEGGSGAFSQAELDQIMAPVALYPDSLLSQILMAATYPDQVVQAVKWSKANPDQNGDDAVTAVQDQGWDPAVASLVAFPQVLEIMGEKPDWVKQMGDAFLADTDAVMATVQSLRKKAKEAGNLESTEQQMVVMEEAPQTQKTIIKIEPADPQVIYVPAYNPTVVYGTWWWPAYPPFYYYPPGYGITNAFWSGIAFGIGIGITNAIWGGFNWGRGDVNINVNRYNNINFNNRINSDKRNVSWKNRNVERRNNAMTNLGNQKASGNRLSGADKRNDFRGRDAQRDKARQSLKNRGIDPDAERKNLRGAGGERVRDQVGKVDRSGKLGAGGDRLGDHGGRDSSSGRSSAGLGERKSSLDSGQRDLSRSSNKRSGNALEGVGNRRSGLSSDRGNSSNRSFQRHSGGGGTRGGGRSIGGGGRGRP